MYNDTRPRWFSFDARRENDFENEPVISCFIGKVFHHWQGRNAWWGTWSETYPRDDSFALALDQTKSHIEKSRTQGSQWTIAELPALVLAGKDDALMICEINTDSPLSDFRLPRTFDHSLESMAALFQPMKPNSVCRFVSGSDLLAPAQFPFLRHRSQSAGSYYMLGWEASNGDIELRPLLAIVTRICKRLQKQ